MNFFEYQRQARRNTQLLVVLFVLAVLAIVAAVSFLVLIVWTAQLSHQGLQSQWMFQKVFMYTAPLVAGVIGLVSLTRISNLGGSGRKVAEFLGAERLELDANDPKDRVLRHVVEEMAIASGMPVPEIYVLREEGGINAFAAGSEPGDAVIGVTQGTIDHLSRDEMQGVVAHEFSHIFNGDMKLNVRLMGTLAGILFLSTIGRGLVRGLPRSRFRSRSRKGDGTAALLFLGLGLMIIGWIGVFFGRWIKAAVSRQREFLADASAVQFTRNPAGLAGALAKISQNGSSVEEARAEEASHFFFSSIKTFFLFSTHPPLEERLQRLGVVRVSEPRFARKDPEPDIVKRVGRPEARDLLVATTVIQGLSAAVRVSAHKPRAAMEMVLGVLAEEAQRPDVMQRLDPAIREAIRAVPSEHRLALVDLALPA
ncbi:MAG: M48 family metallopeptidase, partial [Bdellovibrionales bacterium]